MRTVVVLIAVAASGVLCYPTAAQWFTTANQAVELSGYVHQMAQLPDVSKQAILAQAHEYNARLSAGRVGDPYSTGVSVDAADARAYEAALNLGGRGMMGTLAIPAIDAYLPVFHGTSAATLDLGVGHLHGTALPVGGESTHAVLTAHSGMVSQTLFNNLNQVQVGNVFTLRVLDEILTYEVDQILTVVPEDTEALNPAPGEDYVTLVTCTPIGINTHRLLVRGHRIPTPEPVDPDAQLAGYPGPGFPWWALAIPASALLATFATRPRSAPVPPRGRAAG